MRRTEALQGVRMIKFLAHFGSLRSGAVQPEEACPSGGTRGNKAEKD
jgi:hypothetical protein